MIVGTEATTVAKTDKNHGLRDYARMGVTDRQDGWKDGWVDITDDFSLYYVHYVGSIVRRS